jgi:hypothetical protein
VIGKPKEMLARAGEVLGRDRRVHEVFLCTLGAGSLLRGGFNAIRLRLEGIQTSRLTLFQLGSPVVLLDRDGGRPMLDRIGV